MTTNLTVHCCRDTHSVSRPVVRASLLLMMALLLMGIRFLCVSGVTFPKPDRSLDWGQPYECHEPHTDRQVTFFKTTAKRLKGSPGNDKVWVGTVLYDS